MEDSLYKRVGIYGIRNKINNKIYIGQTLMNFGDRRDSHFSLLRNNKHKNIYLQRSWNKYGADNFDFIVLHDLQEGEDIDELERYYIKYYKDLDLSYNMNLGGESGPRGVHLSEETKKKIGEKNRINGLGRKASEETRKKMSESRKAYLANLTDEELQQFKQQCIKNQRHLEWTDEQRRKFSEMQQTHPNGAKYDIGVVKEIRKLYENDKKSFTEIAEMLNIPRGTVYNIATYRRWKNVS